LLQQPSAAAKLLAAHAPALLLATTVVAVALIRMQRGQSPGFGLQDLIGKGLGHYQSMLPLSAGPRPNLVTELVAQLSWPVVVIALVGLVGGALWEGWRHRWLLACGLLPMLAIGMLAQSWYPRYLLFTLPPLIVCAVWGWRSLAVRGGRFGLVFVMTIGAVCVACMGQQSALLILDPPAARWSPVDRAQYIEGPGSGYGYQQAAEFVRTAPGAPLMLYSLDGHSAYQLRTYLPMDWNHRVEPIFYGQDGKLLSSEAARLENLLGVPGPVWIIVAEPLLQRYLESTLGRNGLEQIRLRRLAAFDKPGSPRSLTPRAQLALYEVTRR
jgi:hypothetical protein